MPLDKIIVLAMALAFFGGILFVFWKARQEENEKKEALTSGNNLSDQTDENLSNPSQGKRKNGAKS